MDRACLGKGAKTDLEGRKGRRGGFCSCLRVALGVRKGERKKKRKRKKETKKKKNVKRLINGRERPRVVCFGFITGDN